VPAVTVPDARETPVRKVEAIIMPFKLDTVTAALRDAGVVDLTVSLIGRTGRSQTGGNGKILVSAVEGSPPA
jgi:hypothetical protein